MPAAMNLAFSVLVAGAATYSAASINLGDAVPPLANHVLAPNQVTASAPVDDADVSNPLMAHTQTGGEAQLPVSYGPDSTSIYDQLEPEVALDADFCTSNEEMYAALQADFAEVPKIHIKRPSGTSYQLWTSEFLGTWTALRTDAYGTSCVVATGVDWHPDDDPRSILSLALNSL